MTVSGFIEDQQGKITGQITAWDGLVSDIPSGWVLCDGNNGTPNMLNRFVKGTPNSSTSAGGTGGQNSFTIAKGQLPAHSHNGSTSTDGSHNHGFATSGFSDGGTTGDGPASFTTGSGDGANTSSFGGGHSHSMSVGTTGSGNSVENRPSYYEVAFIMKI